jgi:8-oxo-dGTP pyrophosphatase MutT (NUDIX family)
MSPGFEPLGKRRVARTSFLTVERTYLLGPEGGWTARDVVRHPGSVVVVPWDGERFAFIRQYRAPVGRHVLELPAGKLDVAGELPEDSARRELIEEIGVQAGTLTHLLSVFPSPGFTDELSHIFLAEDLTPVRSSPQGIEEAAADVVTMTAPEAREALRSGRIDDATTAVGLYAALARFHP